MMDTGQIIRIVFIVLCAIALFAKLLYLYSFDNTIKDIDRRIDEAERKDALKKKNVKKK